MINEIRKEWKTAAPEAIEEFVTTASKNAGSSCGVEAMRRFTDYTRRNSCGECVICREGLLQLAVVTEGITKGVGRDQDVEIITDISEGLIAGSGCDYGREVGKITKQMIAEAAEDFEKHIKRKRCDALVCNKLVSFYVDPQKCTGCGRCLVACPKAAIAGGEGMIAVADQGRCQRCGDCQVVCCDGAVARTAGVLPKLPEKPVPLGSFSAEAAGGGLMARKRRRKAE